MLEPKQARQKIPIYGNETDIFFLSRSSWSRRPDYPFLSIHTFLHASAIHLFKQH